MSFRDEDSPNQLVRGSLFCLVKWDKKWLGIACQNLLAQLFFFIILFHLVFFIRLTTSLVAATTAGSSPPFCLCRPRVNLPACAPSACPLCPTAYAHVCIRTPALPDVLHYGCPRVEPIGKKRWLCSLNRKGEQIRKCFGGAIQKWLSLSSSFCGICSTTILSQKWLSISTPPSKPNTG